MIISSGEVVNLRADLIKHEDQISSPQWHKEILLDIDSLQLYGGIHQKYFGFHRMLSRLFPFTIYYKS